MGTAHQKRQCLLRQDDEGRGNRKFGGCLSVPAPGAYTAHKTPRQLWNKRAVTGERGQMAAGLSSYFIPAVHTVPAAGGDAQT